MPSKVKFSSLAEIAHLVNASSDLGTMLDRIAYATCHYTAWDMCSIMSVDEDAGLSVLMARFDPFLSDPASAPRTWELSTSPMRKVLIANKPLIIVDVQENAEYPYYREDARARNYHTVTILPLPAKDQYGRQMIVAVQSRDRVNVDKDTISFLEAAAQLAAIAVEKAQRLREQTVLAERIRHTIVSVGDLMRKVLSDEAPTNVLSAVELLLGCPVAVADHSAQAVIVGDIFRESKKSEALIQQLQLSLQSPTFGLSNASSPAQLLIGSDLDENSVFDGFPFRRETLSVDGEKAGFFYLLPDGKSFDQVDEMLIQQVAFALSVLLMRTVIRFKERAETHSKILDEIFSGKNSDQEDIRARAKKSGLPLTGSNRLILIGIVGNQEHARRYLRENHRAISFALSTAWPGATNVVAVGTWLVALVPNAKDISDARWNDLLHHSIGCLKSLLPTAPVFVPSALCHDLQDYAQAWQACQRGFLLADRFERRGVVSERDFGPHALLFAAMPALQIDAFLVDQLQVLEDHDAEHRGDLVHTLSGYLLSGCRLQKCADRLKIHVTTLRYRLERIREISALDMDDAESRFSLELALRLRSLRGPSASEQTRPSGARNLGKAKR